MKGAILLGCFEGLLIAMLGVGIVVVYKAERFVNLAHAQLGVLSSMLLAKAVMDAGVSWYVAFPLVVALGVAVGAGCRSLVISHLEGASRTSLMIATLGLAQVILAVAYFDWLGPNPGRLRDQGYPLPFEIYWEFDGLAVTAKHVLIVLIVPAVLGLLVLWLQRSRFGRTMRAAASNPTAARLAGIDLRRTSTAAWAIAGGLSAIGAVLGSPGEAVLAIQASGPLLLLFALGAAALAGFTSMRGAIAAGIGLGIVDGVGAHVGRSTSAGVAALFAALLTGLLIRSAVVGRAHEDDVRVEWSEEPLRIPPAIAKEWFVRRRATIATALAVTTGAVLPFLPWFREAHNTFVLAHVAAVTLAAVSLTVLTGWGGHVSLGQFALVAAGAFTVARLAPRGWSLLATMLVAGAVGAAFGIATGLPAARSRGLSLAVTSLGLAVVGPTWLFHQSWLAPPGTASAPPAYQAGFGRLATQRSVYFAALFVLVAVSMALGRLRRSNSGRVILAVRDNAAAAATFGFAPAVVRLTTFALAGALAGAAGALWLATNRNIAAEVVDPNVSLLILSAVIIGGVSSVRGAVVGCIVVFGVPLLLADVIQGWIPDFQLQLLLSGVGLLATQVFNPGGLASRQRRGYQKILDRIAARRPAPDLTTSPTDGGAITIRRSERSDMTGTALSVRDMRVSFDGVHAVDGVRIEVAAGEIVGLIGANGAGKTTLVDAICGLVPSEGGVTVYGREVAGLRTDERARLGVSRGFQDVRLFAHLTVRETIELALAHEHRTGIVGALVGAPWTRLSEHRAAEDAEAIIDSFGLSTYADVPCDRLSTGTRHLCDLATQVARRPRLMILDEPTSGVAQRETEALQQTIRNVADELGCAILVVEHDLPFIMAIADRVYCLERGRVIAEGTPEAVQADPNVVASYLGRKPRRRRRAAGAR